MDSTMTMTFANIVTFCVFGLIGYSLSKRFRPRPLVPTLLILLLIFVVFGFLSMVGKGTTLIGVQGFKIKADWAMQSMGMLMLVGVVLRAFRRKL